MLDMQTKFVEANGLRFEVLEEGHRRQVGALPARLSDFGSGSPRCSPQGAYGTEAARPCDINGNRNAIQTGASWQVDPLLALVNPLGDLVTFGSLVAAGFWYRRRSDIHKRLMLLATVGGLMPAPLAHLIGHSPLLREMRPIILVPIALLLFASAVYDRISRGRIHPVSLWVALTIFVWDILRNAAIGPGAAWHQLAQFLVR